MILESMTATFGKLEGQTLTFHPGLNVIPAPNEWGKSTWCAFLAAMLYGLDTRAKTTKTALADKERYGPMSGKIELIWNARRITIERTSRGRIPLGEFRAYETESGLSVPELTASNCGQQLLGVERSVFRRAGFIRLSDLPVTADEDLRRRLNALVTTGDESGEAVKLQKSLKELKNRICRKPGGQLPQLMEQPDWKKRWRTYRKSSAHTKTSGTSCGKMPPSKRFCVPTGQRWNTGTFSGIGAGCRMPKQPQKRRSRKPAGRKPLATPSPPGRRHRQSKRRWNSCERSFTTSSSGSSPSPYRRCSRSADLALRGCPPRKRGGW